MKTNHSKQNRTIITLFVGLTVILYSFHPMFKSGLVAGPGGSDMPYHLSRIYSLAMALKEGIFPVKVHPYLCYGYGYGTGFFYSNALLYFPAVLILSGMPLEVAYKVFLFFVIVMIYLSMYYCCFRLSERHDIATLLASLYVLSNQVMNGTYYYFQTGQVTAYIFIPLAITGLYLFLTRNQGKTLLIFGFCGLFYTHAITAFLTGVSCGLVLTTMMIIDKNCYKRIPGIICCAATTLCCTASFWIPMWQQFRAVRMKVLAPWTVESENVLSLQTIIQREGIGIPVILLFLSALVWKIIKKGLVSDTFWIVLAVPSGIFWLLSASFPFWKFLNTHGIHLLQFPVRLYPQILTMCILCCCVIMKHMELHLRNQSIMIWILFAIACNFVLFHTVYQNRDRTTSAEVQGNEIAGVGAGEEWLPLQTQRSMLTTPETAYYEQGEAVEGVKERGFSVFSFRPQYGEGGVHCAICLLQRI